VTQPCYISCIPGTEAGVTKGEIKMVGQVVQVPNGEWGIIVDAFRKDGEDRIEVEFEDGTTVTTTVQDVKVVLA
jgi:hypothetical protein